MEDDGRGIFDGLMGVGKEVNNKDTYLKTLEKGFESLPQTRIF